MKNTLNCVAAGLSSLLLLAGCGRRAEPEAQLVGVYAVKKNGALKELVKIERQGGRYIMRDKVRTPEWSEPKLQKL